MAIQQLLRKPSACFLSRISGRFFSVKELSWCVSSRPAPKRGGTTHHDKTNGPASPKAPIDRFSIVAAMSHPQRIIGVNGCDLPWDHLPEDRELFCSLTRDKLLILGRRTLEEQPDLRHIQHVKHCVVVSTTLNDFRSFPQTQVMLHLARSFPEALHVARKVATAEDEDASFCWVAGGERIYNEAVKHASAEMIHLSLVDYEVEDLTQYSSFARFPPTYWWDHVFRSVSSEKKVGFRYNVYKRHRGY